MDDEVHIAGVLVHAAPGLALSVAAAVALLPGAEVRATGEAGRVVVVCEGPSGEDIVALLERIRELPGVVNVALVYQHAESADAMNEEISDETDAPGIH